MDQPKLERMLRLITMLINNRKTTKEIADSLDCSLRTVQRYIDTIRASGFIVHDRSKGVPYLSQKSKPFKEIDELIHFTEEEALILKKAIDSIDDSNTLKLNLKKKLYNLYDYPFLADLLVKPENSKNVHALIEAIQDKKCVILAKYRSANTNQVSNRTVEPYKFTTNYQQTWCFEHSSQSCKLFNVSRIGSVELTKDSWQHEDKHFDAPIDVFRLSGVYIGNAMLKLNIRAYNLLIEEYPLSEKYIIQGKKNEYIFDAPICSFEGAGRFILGLYNEIEVLGDDGLIEFINSKINSLKKL